MTEAAYFALQAKYDAALRASGFSDIENGRDANSRSVSTMPSGDHDALHFVSLDAIGEDGPFDSIEMREATNSDIYGEPTAVANTPEAKAWQDAAWHAHRLPPEYERRELIVEWTETGKLVDTATHFGISKFAARGTLIRFCRNHGLDYGALMSSADISRGHVGPDDFVDPCVRVNGRCTCPVRRLSKKEIRALQYTPPPKKRK